MAVAYRSSSDTTYATRTNTTITAPTGIQNGDILIIHFCAGVGSSTTPSVTPPAGFTAIPGPTFPVKVNDNSFWVSNWTWYKVASSESGNYTVSHSSLSSQAYMVAVSGADTTTPFGQNETSTAQNQAGSRASLNSSTTAPGITTTRNGSLIIFLSQDWGDLTTTLAAPSGYTLRFGPPTVSGILLAADKQQATAGATGNQTITNNSNMQSGGTPTTNTDPWAGFLIAVQPPNTTSGTLSKTLGALTSSATGTVQPHATLSDTLGSLTLATTGIWAKREATLSDTLGALTLAGTAKAIDKNALSATLGAVTGPGYAPGSFHSSGITYVPAQSGTYQGGSSSYSSYSPTTPTISQGHSAFVMVGGVPSTGSAFTWTVTDNASNTYIKVGNQVDGGGYNTALFYLLNIQGTPTQISLNQGVGGTISYPSIMMDVFSGIPADYSKVGAGLNAQPAPGSGTDAITSGSFNLANAGAFLWGASINVGSTGASNAGTGFTQGQNLASTFTTEYKLSAGSGPQAATFTATDGGGGQNDSFAVAFQLTTATATVSETLGSLGITATGLVPTPPYSTSETLGSLSISSTGTNTDHAHLSVTLGAATLVATGIFQATRHYSASATFGTLTGVGGMASNDPGNLNKTLGSLQLVATAVRPAHAALSDTLGVLTGAAVLGSTDKNTLSKTLGALTLHATSHNEATDHFTLSATLGSLAATFLTGKTKFTTVNQRTHLTVMGYQPGTPPRNNL